MPQRVSPPSASEYAEFHKGYMAAVASERDAIATLERQRTQIEQMRALSPQQVAHRYGKDKWSVKELIGHISDSERVFAYRLLRIARGDATALPGFDEKVVAAGSNADRRELADLVGELSLVRGSTLALVRSLDEDSLALRGNVNEWSLSARAIVFIIAGHFAHHMNVLRDKYRVQV